MTVMSMKCVQEVRCTTDIHMYMSINLRSQNDVRLNRSAESKV